MMWGRAGAVAIAFLLIAGMGAASQPLHINSPESKTHADDNAIQIVLEAHNGYNLTGYNVLTADGSSSELSGDSFEGAELLSDGEHTLNVSATDGNNVVSEQVEFAIDTEGPVITSKYPEDTVFERYPELEIRYEDAVSSVDLDDPDSDVTVWLDGEDVTDTGNATDSAFTLALSDVNISEGEHDATIEVSDVHGHTPQPTHWTFTIPKKPVLTEAEPKGLIDGTDATVSLTAEDPAGIDQSQSRFKLVRDRDGKVLKKVSWDETEAESSVAHGVSVSQSFSDLDDGDYTVEAEVTDNEGNEATTSWTFTVDTTPPSLNIESHSDGDVVTGTQTFTARATDDLSPVDRVIMTMGGEQERVYDPVNDMFHADINTDNVDDGDQTLTVGAQDAAANTVEESIDIVIDNKAPAVSDLSVYPETVASGAQITATVEDTATGVEQVSYAVARTDVSGMLVPEDGALDSDTEAVKGELDTSSLDDGTHEIQIVVKDGAGHTATRSTVITVDSSRQASLSMEQSDDVFVDAGGSTTATVRVSNTGDADDLVKVSASTGMVADITPGERRIRAGETKGFDITLSPSANAAPGPRTVPVTLDGFDGETRTELPVRVQPKPSAQRDIEERLATLQDRFADLTASKSEYDDSVNDEETADTFSATRETLDEIDSLIDDGRYYAASERLDTAEERIEEADAALTGMISTYKRNRMISSVLKVLGLLLLAGIAFGVYRFRTMDTDGSGGFSTESGFAADDRHPAEQVLDEARQMVRGHVATVQEALQDMQSDGRDEREESDRTGGRRRQQPDGWSGFDAN